MNKFKSVVETTCHLKISDGLGDDCVFSILDDFTCKFKYTYCLFSYKIYENLEEALAQELTQISNSYEAIWTVYGLVDYFDHSTNWNKFQQPDGNNMYLTD